MSKRLSPRGGVQVHGFTACLPMGTGASPLPGPAGQHCHCSRPQTLNPIQSRGNLGCLVLCKAEHAAEMMMDGDVPGHVRPQNWSGCLWASGHCASGAPPCGGWPEPLHIMPPPLWI